jgi:hypothetical protein
MNHSPKKRPTLRWLSNFKTEEEKTKRETELNHYLNSWPFARLVEILHQEKETLTRSSDYDSPSWAYQQAHNNGRLQQIETILSMIEGK